jgi:hypothetical protein
LFLRRESSTSSTTRISKMNPSAARRAKRSGRDRQVPARSGRKQQPSVRSAAGKPLFPSNLPRAVRFIAVSASSAGRRKRRRQPGKSLFPSSSAGRTGMSAHALTALSLYDIAFPVSGGRAVSGIHGEQFIMEWLVHCAPIAGAAQIPRSFFNSPTNHWASLLSMPLAAVIFAPLWRWMRRSYQTRSPLFIPGYGSNF